VALADALRSEPVAPVVITALGAGEDELALALVMERSGASK
jgi:hypothetical protein